MEAAGRQFKRAQSYSALGARPQLLSVSWHRPQGRVHYTSLVETLDYEPGQTQWSSGGSKTAVEYGCFFNATGRRTIMLVRNRLLKLIPDGRYADYVIDRMREQGIEIIEGAAGRPDGRRCQWPRGQGRRPH